MSGSSSFERGLSVLSALLQEGPVRADQLADILAMPLSSVYRYLKALRAAGLVSENDGLYGAWSLGGSQEFDGVERTLAVRARPLLERLRESTGETALLTVPSGSRAVCLDQVTSLSAPHNVFPLHQPLPIHAGASKRVLLAYSSKQLRKQVLGAQLERFTPTSPNARTLAELLVHTRRRSAAISHGEFIPGSLAVAVPVLCKEQLVGAIAVSGRRSRCDKYWAANTLRELQRASAELQAVL